MQQLRPRRFAIVHYEGAHTERGTITDYGAAWPDGTVVVRHQPAGPFTSAGSPWTGVYDGLVELLDNLTPGRGSLSVEWID